MHLIRGVLLFLIAGGVLSFPIAGMAGFAPIAYDESGALVASSHETIRLDSEQVIIRLKIDNYTVDAVCRFFNTGETTTQLIGFPKPERQYLSSGPDFWGVETWVDGHEVTFSDESNLVGRAGKDSLPLGAPPWLQARSGWLVRKVTFSGHSATTVRARYKGFYEPGVGTKNAGYSVGIGRSWKDKIGKGSFTIDSAGVGGIEQILTTEYFPLWIGPRALGDNLVTYEIADYEPSPRSRLEVRVGLGRKAVTIPQSKTAEGDTGKESGLKTLKGKVLSSSPTALEIQVTENGSTQVVLVRMVVRDKIHSIRRAGSGRNG